MEDEDYNTEAAENDLAAELDSEEDEDEDEDDEDELDYENFEEIVTDEEVLYTARIGESPGSVFFKDVPLRFSLCSFSLQALFGTVYHRNERPRITRRYS